MTRSNISSHHVRTGAAALAVAALLVAAFPAAGFAGSTSPKERKAARAEGAVDAGRRAGIAADYARLPLRFEDNVGQTDPSVRYVARGGGYALFLADDEVVLALRGQANADSTNSPSPRTTAVRMRHVGAQGASSVEAFGELAGRTNYLTGSDASNWRANVRNYGGVRYAGVYPGVDVVYYGTQTALEYDWVVAPGADPSQIRTYFDGARAARVDQDGALVIETAAGELRQSAPIVYQETDSGRTTVEGRYDVREDGTVGFALGAYDRSLALTIDPVIQYSTFLGGSLLDQSFGIGVDSTGSAIVVGDTLSLNFPTTAPLQTDPADASSDAFVVKLNAAGSQIVYSTYVGGNAIDSARDVAVDAAGVAYVTGFTTSTNFPTTAGALQTTSGGGEDAFVFKLNAAGSALAFSTYLGGSANDRGYGIAFDGANAPYVAGETASANFPATIELVTVPGGSDVFLTKLAPSGASVDYSAVLGGNGNDRAYDVAVTSAGAAFATGETVSTNFPNLGAFQQDTGDNNTDAFVFRLAPNGEIVYSTYLGGSGIDAGFGIALTGANEAVVTGGTASPNFPTLTPIRPFGAGLEAFVTKLNASGNALIWSTYLGGTGEDRGNSVAIDPSGNVVVVGFTSSPNFPTLDPTQPTNRGLHDAFVTKLNPSGTAFGFSTQFGGTGEDFGEGVAVDTLGNVYFSGLTGSTNFPTQVAAQTTYGGGVYDAFAAKLTDASSDLSVDITATPASVPPGGQITYTIDVDNFGPDTAAGVVVTHAIPAGTTFVSATTTQGTCTLPAPGQTGTVTCTLGQIPAGGSATVTVTVAVTATSGTSITASATVTSATRDTVTTNNTDVVTTPTVVPPVITDVDSLVVDGKPYRIKITGSNFQAGVQVFVGSSATPYTNVRYKSSTMLVLKGGNALKALFPKNVPVQIRVVNPDGGQATTTFAR